MGRGNRHSSGFHGSQATSAAASPAATAGTVDPSSATDDHRRRAPLHQYSTEAHDSHGNALNRPPPPHTHATAAAGEPSLVNSAGAVIMDICYTVEDRFIIPRNIAAIPALNQDEEINHLNLASLVGYFISVATLLAFAIYSRRLSNLMSGASPVMAEILFCVSHLSQVTQEQLGWSLFCSGFLSPGCFDWSAAESGLQSSDGNASSGSAGSSSSSGINNGRRVAYGSGNVSGSSGNGSGSGTGGGSSVASAHAAVHSNGGSGNVVRYLLGRRANNVLRQESLRSYLCCSFYSPSAFLVEQTMWFVGLAVALDTVTLQRVAAATFFANAVGWVPVYSLSMLTMLAGALLYAFVNWLPSYEMDETMLSVLLLDTLPHHLLSAYCASLCVTLLFAETMVLEDVRRSFVHLVFATRHLVPKAAAELLGHDLGLSGAAQMGVYVRQNYFYYIDFYFFLGIAFWVSLVLMETAAGISILGIATLLMLAPWLIGSGWSTTPWRALKDTIVYVGFYTMVALVLAYVVPWNGLPFLSNAVQAATILLFMAARCEFKQPGGCAYVLIWVGMLAFYLYEKLGQARGSTSALVWGPFEPSTRLHPAYVASSGLQGNLDSSREALNVVRMVCVTFWQLLSTGISEEGMQLLHFNVVVLGSMLLLSTTLRAITTEGVCLPAFASSQTAPIPAVVPTHAAAAAAAANTAVTGTGATNATSVSSASLHDASSGAAPGNTAATVAASSPASSASSYSLKQKGGSAAKMVSVRHANANASSKPSPRLTPVPAQSLNAVNEENSSVTAPPGATDSDVFHPESSKEGEGNKEGIQGDSTNCRAELSGASPARSPVVLATSPRQLKQERFPTPAVEETTVPSHPGEVTEPDANMEPSIAASALIAVVREEADVSNVAETAAEARSGEANDDDEEQTESVEEAVASPAPEDAEEAAELETVENEERNENNDAAAEPGADGVNATPEAPPTSIFIDAGVAEEAKGVAEEADVEKDNSGYFIEGSQVVENASITSPVSQSEVSITSPLYLRAEKAMSTTSASRNSRSSVSGEEPRKSRRERGRERRRLQQEQQQHEQELAQHERAQQHAKPPSQQLAQQHQAPQKVNMATAIEVKQQPKQRASATATPTTTHSPLPVPRSLAEGYKKSVESSPGASAKSEVTSANTIAMRTAERKDSQHSSRSTLAETKQQLSLSLSASSTPVTVSNSGGRGQAKGADTTEPAGRKNKSPVTATSVGITSVTAPFPLPKPRHEQQQQQTAAAVAMQKSASPAGLSGAPVAATASILPANARDTAGAASALSGGNSVTAAEKLRRSAAGLGTVTPTERDERATKSAAVSGSSSVVQSPATATATAPPPLQPTIVATAPTKSSPSLARDASSHLTSPAQDLAVATASFVPSVPLPRSVQTAELEAKEKGKETLAGTAAATAAAAVRPVGKKGGTDATKQTESLQRAWRETQHSATPSALVPVAPAVEKTSTEEKSTEVPAPAISPTVTAAPATVDEADESYDLDRVLNFLELKMNYADDVGGNDGDDRSSSADSNVGGYRGGAFFSPESPQVPQSAHMVFPAAMPAEPKATTPLAPSVVSPTPTPISLFSTVPQPLEHTASTPDFAAFAATAAAPPAVVGMSGSRRSFSRSGSISDTPLCGSRLPQVMPSSALDWAATAAGTGTFGESNNNSNDSGFANALCPSGGSFHVFSTHPQNAAAAAAAAAAQASSPQTAPSSQYRLSLRSSPNPARMAAPLLDTALLRPASGGGNGGGSDGVISDVPTPPRHVPSPPMGYYQLPHQTSPLPPKAEQALAQPHVPFSVSTAHMDLSHLNSLNAAAAAAAAAGNPGACSSSAERSSVLSRLRGVSNARGIGGELAITPPLPPNGAAGPTGTRLHSVQPPPPPPPLPPPPPPPAPPLAGAGQPMMMMMATPNGQMALYPVMYNQPLYVMDANGVMRVAPNGGVPPIVFAPTPPQPASSQGFPPPPPRPGAMTAYQMAPDSTFVLPSPPQGGTPPVMGGLYPPLPSQRY